MFSVDSSQFTSGPYNFSDAPLFRPLGRMRTNLAALPVEESAYVREVGVMERSRENPTQSHNREYPRQFGCGAINKDRSYYFTTSLMSNIYKKKYF